MTEATVHDVEQRSEAWYMVRLGKATASEFGKILTPAGKESAQCKEYAARLAGEKILQRSIGTFKGNDATRRGIELEGEAISWYELVSGNKVVPVGFHELGGIGCSVDGLVEGGKRIVEIKCPLDAKHIFNVIEMRANSACPIYEKEYKPQVQGQLMITGREICDLIVYHPLFPSAYLAIERDDEYIALLNEAAQKCVELSNEYVTIVEKIIKGEL